MATDPTYETEILNGVWWEAPWPLCWRAQTQWISGDVWILLVEKYAAKHGGWGRMVHQIDGRELLTKRQLAEYLADVGWFRIEPPADDGPPF